MEKPIRVRFNNSDDSLNPDKKQEILYDLIDSKKGMFISNIEGTATPREYMIDLYQDVDLLEAYEILSRIDWITVLSK